MLPKSDRPKNIFQYNNKKPQQIGSNYIFINNKIQDKIDLIYLCSRKDIEITKRNIEVLINLWSNELIKFIKERQNIYYFHKEQISNKREEDYKGLRKKLNFEIDNYIMKNNLKLFKKYYEEIYEIGFVKVVKHDSFNEGKIITFFDIDNFSTIINKLSDGGIEIPQEVIVLNKFINLDKISINKIVELYPFLISKATKDIDIKTSESNEKIKKPILIEPNLKVNGLIGVIDTYGSFSNGWENYVEYIEEPFPKIEGIVFNKDYSHGTSVSSLIIGNDIINDKFKDDLGIFKVKLFGILPQGKISMFYFMKKIEVIIKNNHKQIKIWNLSIDSENNDLGISLLGHYFDILQKKYNVLFVISAGNTHNQIASGADSLSAITVGSLYENTNNELKIASYSGSKNIFGRFKKPNTYEVSNDISAKDSSYDWKYSIDESGYMVWNDGTSFSAPLTARKCCYLMNKYNLSLESIKALINILTEVSDNNLPNINFNNSLDMLMLIIEGKASPKDSKIINIKLPTYTEIKNNFEKVKQDFTYAIGISYFVVPSNKLGDEYSTINLEFKIVAENKMGNKRDIFKSKKTEKINGINATEKVLLEHFKKYDPNRVLINKDFDKPYGYTKDTNNFYIKLDCSDLFERNNETINYACAILLKEKNIGSLNNFEILNEKNIIKEEIIEHEYLQN
ncbi:S8 family serine peptidase [Spiroplasma turonicum]|uniref:Peptidase S8/S53 domain-containing protein n=1 Tax=Spiroplasma turonicum TaxID=216946 RepID=A0A0K1P682_9MOLU|nr:S8 family serine peptidase [Spiroplasma turonicum]AKU79828.1 hypothetical protein STURON_00582 [Spiroplasma turonicum]ALX70843.1 serine protease [Spiroplasma turonicum]